MPTIQSTSEQFPPQLHDGHRILDITLVGHIHPRMLCLDCHVEFERQQTPTSRTWMLEP